MLSLTVSYASFAVSTCVASMVNASSHIRMPFPSNPQSEFSNVPTPRR
jgi:hypothetical protein